MLAVVINELGIMYPLMHDLTFDRTHVFCPLTLDVYKRPLPLTERKVLYARKRQEAIVIIVARHINVTSLTPLGKAVSSTVTS